MTNSLELLSKFVENYIGYYEGGTRFKTEKKSLSVKVETGEEEEDRPIEETNDNCSKCGIILTDDDMYNETGKCEMCNEEEEEDMNMDTPNYKQKIEEACPARHITVWGDHGFIYEKVDGNGNTTSDYEKADKDCPKGHIVVWNRWEKGFKYRKLDKYGYVEEEEEEEEICDGGCNKPLLICDSGMKLCSVGCKDKWVKLNKKEDEEEVELKEYNGVMLPKYINGREVLCYPNAGRF